MSDTVISVENLSKAYQLGVIGTGTFYGDLQRWWAKQRGRPDPYLKIGEKDHGNRQGETVWALKDINIQIRQGEAVGIIGRNGAGKSTLLKILSRVTAPTSGEIKVKGRVASLLEVGTGFHPELTGRENIFMNGAIMGMDRREITNKFDEIVDFSGVEKFIDTPVKRYSSGMYVRLAFAVAAHLEPDILVVDEVLAVGDAEFQKKCLGKMGDVAHEGRTVLFVSHNMTAMTRLCKTAIWLDVGQVHLVGAAIDVSAQYLHSGMGVSNERLWDSSESAPGDDVARLCAVRILSEGRVTSTVDIRRPVTIEMEFINYKPNAALLAAFSFFNEQGIIPFVSGNFSEREWVSKRQPAGIYRAKCTIPGNLLSEGQISVTVEVSTREPLYQIHFLQYDVVAFQVVDTGEPGSVRAGWGRNILGVVRPALDWRTEYLGPVKEA